jgi:hypothetical protein
MKKIFYVLLASLVMITSSRAGTVNLYQMATPSGSQSQGNFTICGTENRSFFITYTFSAHNSCWPNRYKVTFKLFKNGVEINSSSLQVSSTFANQGFYNISTTPGIYSAQVTLERRPCAGAWYTAETLTSNTITASTLAVPNFSINTIAAVDPAISPVPSIECNAGLITIDASTTTCETTYWLGIWETTSNWWERTYQYEWGGWFQGEAPNYINLQNLASTSGSRWGNGPNSRKNNVLMGGKITNASDPSTVAINPSFIGKDRYYTVEICTGEPTWTCKKIQIKLVW